MSKLTVGIDWGAQVMAVCVLDERGNRLFEGEVARQGASIEPLIARLVEMADHDPTRLSVALELPRDAVIEAFLARDVAVYSLNPKQLDRFRDRHTVAGAKDDALDAFVLADALRTDRPLFRRVEIEGEQLVLLRERSRAYDELTTQALALANQLRALLTRYYVEALSLGSLHDSPWIWRLLEVAPNPHRLRAPKIGTLISRLEKKNTRLPSDVEAKLLRAREGKPLPCTRGVITALSERVQRLLPLLRATHKERQRCLKELHGLVDDMKAGDDDEDGPTDMAILLSMPGIGHRIAACLQAEAFRAITARDGAALRRLSGVAPVSHRSGGRRKRPRVSMRRAFNVRLGNALHHWAGIAIRHDERARALYQTQRARDHGYARALRTVSDRLIPMLMAALKAGQLYDPEKRRAAPKAA